MAKNIEPKLVTIGDYLKLDSDVKFLIPEYQRKYAWDIYNCDKLWSDITDFIENDNKDPYFFGTIILNCDKNDTELGLIDGQQRTTTFMLLLKALLIRINEALIKMVDDSDAEQLRNGLRDRRKELINILYKVDTDDIPDRPDAVYDSKFYKSFNNLVNNSNQETYKKELTKIMQSVDFAEAENSTETIPYKQKDNKYTRFFRNFNHFYSKEDLNDITFLNRFTKTILKECQVIEIKSWKIEQAITMFNSLNSDGMPLTDSDIIYSKMYAFTSEDKRNEFSIKWECLKELINDLENNKIISITSLLNQKMYLYRSINGDTRKGKDTVDVTTPGLRRYYTEINTSLIKKPLEFCDELIILAMIWNIAKESNIVKVLFKFNDNSKLFLASYFKRFDYLFESKDNKITITDENRNILIDNIEKMAELMLRLFTVLSLVDAGYSSSYFKTFLFKEEVKMADSSIPFDEIKSDFTEHINNCWKKDVIISRIKDYEKHDIVYLNEYLFAKENNYEFQIKSDIDIEHIMPQSGKNSDIICNDAQMEDKDMFLEYINKVGNKILLEYSINRTIGNEWFRTKISEKISDKTGYVDSNYPIAKYLVNKFKDEDKPYWTKTDIDDATQKASERISNFIFGC